MAHLAHYREAHPLPFVVSHWINLISMISLIITGFYIHYPFIPGWMGVARGVHIFCGVVLLLNMIVRVILSFIVKDAQRGGTREGLDLDYKNFFPSKANRHQFFSWIKYYLFIKKEHPKGSKYGSLQKLCYFLIPFLILASAYSGFALWETTSSWALFAWGTNLVGGVMNMRIIHYFLMWVFIIFMIIHIYLANIEGTAATKLMFLRKEHGGLVVDPETGDIIGEDLNPETYTRSKNSPYDWQKS